MAEGRWEGAPASPMADMRERDGLYDILLDLPEGLDPQSLKVSTSGNVLSLFAGSAARPGATFVKQFFIPGGAERVGAVETSVSNGLVRIRVRPSGG